jgi:hypothetical protein
MLLLGALWTGRSLLRASFPGSSRATPPPIRVRLENIRNHCFGDSLISPLASVTRAAETASAKSHFGTART